MNTSKNIAITVVALIVIALAITAGIMLGRAKAPTGQSATSTASTSGSSANTDQSGLTMTLSYTDPANHFSISYPGNTDFIINHSESATAYLPICDEQYSAACVYFASSTYPGTNFEGAGVSVNILPNETSTKCTAPQGDAHNATSTIINGTTYTQYYDGDAAMSHQVSGYDYMTFHNNTCFELTTRTETVNAQVFPAGAISPFTAAMQTELNGTLDTIIASITLK